MVSMRTLSLDLRERILACYDNSEGTREQVASRYRVSLGMVKKLLQQRRRTGDIAARHRYSGRKAMILESHRQEMSSLLKSKPDLSLKELRRALGLKCSLPAIHYSLIALGLTYKKDTPGERTGPARHCSGAPGGASPASDLGSDTLNLY